MVIARGAIGLATAIASLPLVLACTTGDRPAGYDRIGVTASSESGFEVLYLACSGETVTEVRVVDGSGSADPGRLVWRASGEVDGDGLLRFAPGSVPAGMEETIPAADRSGDAPLVAMVETDRDDHQVGFELNELSTARVHAIGTRELSPDQFLQNAEESC